MNEENKEEGKEADIDSHENGCRKQYPEGYTRWYKFIAITEQEDKQSRVEWQTNVLDNNLQNLLSNHQ